MKGLGYSSKVAVLLPLAKEHLGSDMADRFKRLLTFILSQNMA